MQLYLRSLKKTEGRNPARSNEENTDVTPQTCREQSFIKHLDYQEPVRLLKSRGSLMKFQNSSIIKAGIKLKQELLSNAELNKDSYNHRNVSVLV